MRNLKSWIRQGPVINPNLAIISLFFLIYLLYIWLSHISFFQTMPNGIYFSEATLEGVNVGKRVNTFYVGILFSAVGFFLIYTVLYFLHQYIRLKPAQEKTLAIISLTGLFTVFSSSIGWNAETMSAILIMIYALKLFFYALGNRKGGIFRLLTVDVLTNLAIVMGFVISFGFTFSFNTYAFSNVQISILYGVTILAIPLILITAKHFLYWNIRVLLFLCIPIAFIPIFAFLVGEITIYSKITFDYLVRFKILFFILLAVSFMGIWLLLLWRKYYLLLSTRKILEIFFLPSALVGFILMVYYQPFPLQSTEIFELANPANSLLRIFEMNQLPFIDYMSSHMLSEQWYSIVYYSIFGFSNNLDFLIYEFFNRLILLFIIYYFLNKLFPTKELSMLFIFGFPFIFSVFYANIFLAVIVFFMGIKTIENQTAKSYFLLILSIILLILWRLDTGSAALLTSLVFVPIVLFISKIKTDWRSMLQGLGLIILLGVVSLLIAFIIRSPQHIFQNFMAALHYVKANQAHGFSILAYHQPHQFYIYHFFFPLLSLGCIIIAIIKLRGKSISIKDSASIPGLASIFFFLIYITNAQRGLVRHSFLQNTEMFLTSTFFLAFALFLTFLFENYIPRISRYLVFYSTLFFTFVLFKFFPLGSGDTLFEKAITNPGYQNFDLNFSPDIISERTIINEAFRDNMYKDLKQLLDANITDKQTFLDFSNTPMLYYYCNRPIPGYFNQNLQNTVDDYLQLHLLKYLNPEEIPVVVFSNFPPNWFDATDGVPNVMRYYLIAEYIFEHYEPYGIISNKSIWVAKDSNFEWVSINNDPSTTETRHYNYHKAAFSVGQYYQFNKADYLKPVFEYNVPDEYIDHQLIVQLPPTLHTAKNAYIHLEIDSDINAKDIKLYLYNQEEIIGEYSFEVFRGKRYYMLRAGNHYKWFTDGADNMVLQIEHGIYPKKINFLKDNRIENQDPVIH